MDHLAPNMSFRTFAARFAVLFALACLPVLFTANLPLFDYPNHLARMYLLDTLPTSPVLRQYYTIAWRPLPNLAMDLIVPPLGHVVPLAVAGKLFVLLTLFLLAVGPALLHRALFGAWSNVPLLAFLLLYGRILLWGFLNYLFGLGLAFVLFAAWLLLRSRAPPMRLVLGTCFVLVLYFAHLEALGVYAVLLGAYEIQAAWQSPEARHKRLLRLVLAGLPFLLPLAILLLDTHGLNATIGFSPLGRKFDLLFGIFDAEDRMLDIVCFAVAVGALTIALWRRWLTLAPAMRLPLIALGVTYLAMPTHILSAFGADHRLPLAMGLVLVASLRWAGSARTEARFMLGAAMLFAVRLGAIMLSWHASNAVYTRMLTVLDAISANNRVAVAYPPAELHATVTPFMHVPTLAIIRRDAFVPTLFASPAQQPVRLTPRFQRLADALTPTELWGHFVAGRGEIDAAALACYDSVVFVAHREFHLAVSDVLRLVAATPEIKLYAVVTRQAHPGDCHP
jgi:hypothetical protein